MPDKNITLPEFINTIFDTPPEGELVCLTMKDSEGGWGNYGGTPRNLERLVKPGAAAWYVCLGTIAPQPDGYLVRDRDSVRCMYAIALDDVGTKVDPAAVTVEPSWSIETSEGNYQYGYLLDPPTELTPESEAHYEACQRALATAGLTDPGARGVYRVVRVPGSLHRTGFVATVTGWAPDRTWSLDELMSDFDLDVVPGRPRPPSGAPGSASLDTVDDPVLDWLRARGDVTGVMSDRFVEILCPWRHEHTTEGDTAGYTPVGYDQTHYDSAFSCFHEHCQGRGKREFLAWVAEQGGPGAVQEAPAPEPGSGEPGGTVRLDKLLLPDVRLRKVDGGWQPRLAQLLTKDNLAWVIEQTGVEPRFNMMTNRPEYPPYGDIGGVLRVRDALLWLDIPAGMGLLHEMMRVEALKRPYHPMEDWLRGLAWDGQDRLGALAGTVETPDEMWPVYLRRWLLQVVHGVTGWRQGPRQLPHVLVFAGEQGIGKSTWFQNLLPATFFKPEAALHLDRAHARDDMVAALRTPVSELSEIDTTFRKSDVGALKTFLSRSEDEIRLPYAREAEIRPRMTSFCGSVNHREFLQDETGSRRFWPVEALSFEWNHGIDMDQVWAQVTALAAQGEGFNLTRAEDLRRIEDADRFRNYHSIVGELENYFTPQLRELGRENWFPLNLADIGNLIGAKGELRAPLARTAAVRYLDDIYGQARKLQGVQKARMMPVWPEDQHLVRKRRRGHLVAVEPG